MRPLLPLLLAGLPALCATITFDRSIPRLSSNLEVSLDGRVVTANAGQIGVRLDGTDPMLTYCADPLVWLLVGPVEVTPVPSAAFLNGARLAWLLNTYNPLLTQGWEAAALQLAIWEVILDNNSNNLNTGRTRATSQTNAQVVTLATTMLQASAGQSSSGVTFWVPVQGTSYSQTLFGVTPSQYIPEPSTLALIAVGLFLTGALQQRRRSSASPPKPDTKH